MEGDPLSCYNSRLFIHATTKPSTYLRINSKSPTFYATQSRMRRQLSPLLAPCGRRPLLRSPRAHVTPAPLRATAIMADSQPFANELRPWLDQSASANVRDASIRQHSVARDIDGGTIGGDCVVEWISR